MVIKILVGLLIVAGVFLIYHLFKKADTGAVARAGIQNAIMTYSKQGSAGKILAREIQANSGAGHF